MIQALKSFDKAAGILWYRFIYRNDLNREWYITARDRRKAYIADHQGDLEDCNRDEWLGVLRLLRAMGVVCGLLVGIIALVEWAAF